MVFKKKDKITNDIKKERKKRVKNKVDFRAHLYKGS